MIGSIVWVRYDEVGMPNDQRAQVLEAFQDGLLVRMMGNDEVRKVALNSICAIEVQHTHQLSKQKISFAIATISK